MKNLLVVKAKNIFVLFLFGICAAIAVNAQNNGCADLKEPRIPSSSRLFGLTIDSIDKIGDIVDKIKEIKKDASDQKPIVRIVFDFPEADIGEKRFRLEEADFVAKAKEYKTAIEKLRPHAYVVGLLVDSSYVHKMRHDRRRTHVAAERTKAYANTLKNCVDVWELGNEINGEWVGWESGSRLVEPLITLEQLAAAREIVADEVMQSFVELKRIIPNSKTALTFYYNDDGTNKAWDTTLKSDLTGKPEPFGKFYSMTTWANEQRKRLPDVDHVWLSYYEDDNAGVTPNKDNMDVSKLVKILVEMADLFKTAEIAIGEMGPQCKYKNCPVVNNERIRTCRECKDDQPLFIKNYYGDGISFGLDKQIRDALSNPASGWNQNRIYNGGYFYWYFRQDAVVNGGNRRTVEALKNAFNKWYKK